MQWKRTIPMLIPLLIFACGESSESSVQTLEVKQLYKKYCTACHGPDGKKQFNDAPDLSVSQLTIEDRMHLIRNGKGLMVAYKGILTEEEIRLLAEYTLQFAE
jgi:mono/diheme cytochrome c family protein